MLVFLLSQIEANSQITLDNLATLVQEKFQIQISVSSIHRALEKMDVTWKNILPIPVN
jgi:transposase